MFFRETDIKPVRAGHNQRPRGGEIERAQQRLSNQFNEVFLSESAYAAVAQHAHGGIAFRV